MVYDGRNDCSVWKNATKCDGYYVVIIPSNDAASNDAEGVSIVFMTMLQKYIFITVC